MKDSTKQFIHNLRLVSGSCWLTLNAIGIINNAYPINYNWSVYLIIGAIEVGITLLFTSLTPKREKNTSFLSTNPLSNYGLLFNVILLVKLISSNGNAMLNGVESYLLLTIVVIIGAFKKAQEN